MGAMADLAIPLYELLQGFNTSNFDGIGNFNEVKIIWTVFPTSFPKLPFSIGLFLKLWFLSWGVCSSLLLFTK